MIQAMCNHIFRHLCQCDQFPFSILNSYGVLDAKKLSEDLLEKKARELNFQSVVVRPGRLVGEPFTNFDLAKLLNLNQGSNEAITVNKGDILSGDMERKDVAETISRILKASSSPQNIKFSIVNKPGNKPSESEWTNIVNYCVSS